MAVAIREQVDHLAAAAGVIRARQAVAPAERAARLRARVQELCEFLPTGPDEKRLELEIALLAEKSDVQEEIIRFEAHLAALRKLIGGAGVAETKSAAPSAGGKSAPTTKPKPVGPELGFVLQELLRETNTTGSKTPDIETVKAVIAAKTAIDRIKEIAANVV